MNQLPPVPRMSAGPLAGLTVAEAADLMARARAVTVADGFELCAREYDRIAGDPERLQEATGSEYLAARCRALAGLFRDEAAPDRCALEGEACFLDALRGFRVLALAHPRADAKDLYAALGNMAAGVLSSRLGHALDVAPELATRGQARPTLLAWHEQVVRASQIARREGTGGARSQGGIALVGRQAETRARMCVDLLTQGMAELGILIRELGTGDA